MKRVIHFSGGRTSGYMTLMMQPTEDDVVLFTDTGREHPGTYKFLDDFEAHENIRIHRAAYTHASVPGLFGFEAFVKQKKYLPNRVHRICTEELKVLTAKRYLRQELGLQRYTSYIGFRADEIERFHRSKNDSKKIEVRYPLIAAGVTKEMVNTFWAGKAYNLEIPSILGNCDLCFLKGKNAIIRILQYFPELAEKWIADEALVAENRPNAQATFIKDIKYSELLKIAQSMPVQKDKELSALKLLSPAYNCSCTSF